MVCSTVKERGTYLMAVVAHSSTLSGVEIDQMHVSLLVVDMELDKHRLGMIHQE